MLYNRRINLFGDEMKNFRKFVCVILVMVTAIFSVNITAFAEDEPGVAGDGNTVDKVEIPATKIMIRGNNITLDIGDTAHVNYALRPTNSDDYVIMKSLFTNVATVTQDGIITAVGPGTGIITVRTGSGKKARMTVNVRTLEESFDGAPRIELDDGYVNLRVGETSKIVPHLFPTIIENPLFMYSVSDKSIADVNGSGTVTAKSPGFTTIEVTVGDTKAIYRVSVYRNRYKGIDVSRWQEEIDWAAVKTDGIDFAIIRSGYGKATPDEKLAANIKGCEKNNIPYGLYHYTYAKTPEEAVIEAEFFVNRIKNYSPDLPLVLDIEEPFYKKMSKKQVEAIIDSFMKVLKANGYQNAAVYSNAYFFTNTVDTERIVNAYPIWIASWGDTEKLNAFYDGRYFCWQYSSSGTVAGINGDVDLNYLYY
jgi:GH25 family lysozyme M1 (1,4-beta-N-acetylmuramidase)